MRFADKFPTQTRGERFWRRRSIPKGGSSRPYQLMQIYSNPPVGALRAGAEPGRSVRMRRA